MTEQATETKRPIVRVACTIPNGIMIRLQKPGPDDGTGVRMIAHDGPGIRLNGPPGHDTGAGATEPTGLEPGITELDAEWWAAWSKQHAMDPLLTGGHIRVIEDKPEGEENPTEP